MVSKLFVKTLKASIYLQQIGKHFSHKLEVDFDGCDENLIRTLKSFRLHDSVQLQLGDGADCDMLHDGSEMIIRNDTGNFTINQRTDDGDLILKCDDGSGGTTAYLTLDGSAESIEISKKMQFLDQSIDLQACCLSKISMEAAANIYPILALLSTR